MNSKEHDIERIKKEGTAEWKTFRKEYDDAVGSIQSMKNPTLFLLCIIGTAMVVYFDTVVFRFLGLIVFAYGVYAFALREGHRDGYVDHYAASTAHHTEEL